MIMMLKATMLSIDQLLYATQLTQDLYNNNNNNNNNNNLNKKKTTIM